MGKIYMDAKDKNVAANIIYVDKTKNSAGSRTAWVDPEHTIAFTDDELADACFKGALVAITAEDDSVSYMPVLEFTLKAHVELVLVYPGSTDKIIVNTTR